MKSKQVAQIASSTTTLLWLYVNNQKEYNWHAICFKYLKIKHNSQL